jgi:phage protein D
MEEYNAASTAHTAAEAATKAATEAAKKAEEEARIAKEQAAQSDRELQELMKKHAVSLPNISRPSFANLSIDHHCPLCMVGQEIRAKLEAAQAALARDA